MPRKEKINLKFLLVTYFYMLFIIKLRVENCFIYLNSQFMYNKYFSFLVKAVFIESGYIYSTYMNK